MIASGRGVNRPLVGVCGDGVSQSSSKSDAPHYGVAGLEELGGHPLCADHQRGNSCAALPEDADHLREDTP